MTRSAPSAVGSEMRYLSPAKTTPTTPSRPWGFTVYVSTPRWYLQACVTGHSIYQSRHTAVNSYQGPPR